MKVWGIFRFELGYQLRRLGPWLLFGILVVVARRFVRGNYLSEALYDDFYLNSPFVIASTTVFCGLLWFLLAATVAGDAGARDAESGMHPLVYTAPLRRAEYLGGRFLAAFALNALILLGIPLGIAVAVYGPGVDPEVVGPFRPAAYLTAYALLSLPNAFVGTAIQFAWAVLGRRAIASYLGSVLLFFVAYGGMIALNLFVGRQELAALLDVFGHVYITSDLILGWTPIQKNTRLIGLEGTLLRSRLFWLGVALATLAFVHRRFAFAHPSASPGWTRFGRRGARAPTPGAGDLARRVATLPDPPRSFGAAMRARQTLAIAATSFRTLAWGRGGLVVLAALATLAVLFFPENLKSQGTPLLPRTEYLLTFLTASLTNPFTPWVITPLLIVLFAGELAWRERQAGLGEIADALPVPEWASFVGKLLGLALLLAVWMALLAAAGVAIQLRMGYSQHELGLWLTVLFGLQLPEYLLFAALALAIQGVVRQKYLGHLGALLAYLAIAFAAMLGVEHDLLVFGSAPAWTYTDMRGFGPSLGPWRWSMLYWTAWAALLAVLATLLWARGAEGEPRVRLRLARLRWTRATAAIAAGAAVVILVAGGWIVSNTYLADGYRSDAEVLRLRAEYERRYARFADAAQPAHVATRLRVEIHPRRRAVEIRGSYRLVNRGPAPIDTVHLATVPGVRTDQVTFDRPAALRVADDDRGHRIYALARPLRAGDSLNVGFRVRYEPRGFGGGGVAPVTASSSYFKNGFWLPAIGYQRSRELLRPTERRAHGLAARPIIPLLDDSVGVADLTGEGSAAAPGAARVSVETVVGTDADQVAAAPGTLRRSWTEDGRRYFHYATASPIGDEYALFSARYAVHRERWREPGAGGRSIPIEVFYHPRHAANLNRILRGVRASLAYNTRAFGPYPYDHLRLVENPGRGMGAHADAATIDFTEGFSRYDPDADPRGLDLPFAVIAHEMGHQWGVPYAFTEGAPLLSESFAWYAAMGAVEASYGPEHLRRLLRFFRQPHPIPPIRQSVPLLRALDPYAAYRKGPFALRALAEYAGEERVNLAFRRLRERQGSGAPPLATSLDLYRELHVTTPDSLRPLLHDLFAANTFWDFQTLAASAEPLPSGAWRVTLRVRASKQTVDPTGAETELPMDEWVEVGVFAAATAPGPDFGETLHLRRHRIRSGEQTIILTVPRRPADAGIDPFHLLIETERFDNVERVETGG